MVSRANNNETARDSVLGLFRPIHVCTDRGPGSFGTGITSSIDVKNVFTFLTFFICQRFLFLITFIENSIKKDREALLKSQK